MKFITLDLIQDAAHDPTKTLSLRLSGPVNARLGTALQTLAIMDDF